MNFWKATGEAEATKRFWNQIAPNMDWKNRGIQPVTKHHSGTLRGGRGLNVNKIKGEAKLLTELVVEPFSCR
jgi:hypothetical protein